MKLSEFIENYKNTDAEKLSNVNIKRYIPLREKINIIMSTNEMFLEAELDIGNYCGVAETKEMCKFFDVLLSYIDVEVDNRCVETYDICMAIGIDDFVLKLIQKKDYERFCLLFDQVYDLRDSVLLRDSLGMIGQESLSSDIKKMAKELVENKEVFSNLSDIIKYNSAR